MYVTTNSYEIIDVTTNRYVNIYVTSNSYVIIYVTVHSTMRSHHILLHQSILRTGHARSAQDRNRAEHQP